MSVGQRYWPFLAWETGGLGFYSWPATELMCDLGQVSTPFWSHFPKLDSISGLFQLEHFLRQTDSVQAMHLRTQSKGVIQVR